jgi:hypothetical protein
VSTHQWSQKLAELEVIPGSPCHKPTTLAQTLCRPTNELLGSDTSQRNGAVRSLGGDLTYTDFDRIPDDISNDGGLIEKLERATVRRPAEAAVLVPFNFVENDVFGGSLSLRVPGTRLGLTDFRLLPLD